MLRFLISDSSKEGHREFERPDFSDAIRADLKEFLECASRLNECSFAQDPSFLSKISFKLGKDGSIRSEGPLPSDEQIEAFLLRLRPIYLQKERTHFERIANHVSKHINDSAITETIRAWKREYDGRTFQEMITMSVGPITINSEQFLDDYLNAIEYHRDKERRKKIHQVAEHFPLDVQKPIVAFLLFFRLSAINRLTSFLDNCFECESNEKAKIKL
jgi:hypothetical protein